MAAILASFRTYAAEYAKSFLRVSDEQLAAMTPSDYMARIEQGMEENARFLHLKVFGWALGEKFLDHYASLEVCHPPLRQAAKIVYLMKGDFRHNDYETHEFADESLAALLPRLPEYFDLRREPVEPTFEDGIHFLGNFIAWHKRARGAPLRLW